jgi:hypothetical protein
MDAPSAPPAINPRIMGLKFMQRRHPKQQQQAPQPPSGGQAAAEGARSADEWTLEASGSAAPAVTGHVVLEEDALAAANDDGALVRFRAGRRSFGAFNPRLEKRLAEIRAGQRAARDAAVAEARAAEERRVRETEHAALIAREAEAEAAERESALEMAQTFAAKYDRFVPPAGPGRGANGGGANGPPVVSNPVHVRDTPAGRGGAAGRRQ